MCGPEVSHGGKPRNNESDGVVSASFQVKRARRRMLAGSLALFLGMSTGSTIALEAGHVVVAQAAPSQPLFASGFAANSIGEFSTGQLSSGGSLTPSESVYGNGTSLNGPQGLAFDRNGDLWEVAHVGNAIEEFTPSQLANLTTGVPGPTPHVTISGANTGLAGPTSISFDSSGNLWVTNTGLNQVLEFGAGQLVSGGNVAPDGTIYGDGSSLNGPEGIAFDSSGDLWVSDTVGTDIEEFTPTQLAHLSTGVPGPTPHVIISITPSFLAAPVGLAFDSSGDLWVANDAANTLLDFTPTQLVSGGNIAPAIQIYGNGTSLNAPREIAFDSSGDLWVAEDTSGYIEEFTPTQLSATGAPTPTITVTGGASGDLFGLAFLIPQPSPPPPATPTTTSLTSSLTSVATSQSVTLEASVVSVSGPASGTVSFSANGTQIAGCIDQPINPSTGSASCTTTFPTSASESIVASFNGTSLYSPSSSSALVIEVGSGGTSTTTSTTTPPTTTSTTPTTTPSSTTSTTSTTPPSTTSTTSAPVSSGATKPGYIVITPKGGVTSFGSAPDVGSLASKGITPAFPIVGDDVTPNGAGYWLVGSDGGVFAFGNASFYGSMSGKPLSAPVVAITSTPNGQGYWLVGSDGGVFAFGNAGFYGSTGGASSSSPVVGLAATTNGHGYWIVRANGQVMVFGDATSSKTLVPSTSGPVTSIASDPTGTGFWVVTSSGLVIGSNGAPSLGSLTGIKLAAPIVQMVPTSDGKGYWLIGSDGGVFAFGDAPFLGSSA